MRERKRKKGGLVVHRREENSLEHLNFKYDDINPKYCEMMMKNSDAMTTTKKIEEKNYRFVYINNGNKSNCFTYCN